MADSQKGTVDINIVLKGIAEVERGLKVVQQGFQAVAGEAKQSEKKFKTFGESFKNLFTDLKAGIGKDGFKGFTDLLKTSFKTFFDGSIGLITGFLGAAFVEILKNIGKGIVEGYKFYFGLITNQIKGVFESVKSITGFDKFFSSAGVIEGSIEVTKYTKQLQREAAQTGIAIKELVAYKVAMENAGVSADQLGKRLAYMGKQLTKAFAGTAPDAMRVLRNLNITEEKFIGLTTLEKFLAIAKALNELGNASEQAHAAMLLFERDGYNILPLLRNMEELTRRADVALGGLPATLDDNNKALVRLENNLSYFDIKRRQFFTGFLIELHKPINEFLDRLMAIDFQPFGKKLADHFRKTFASIQLGDAVGAASNFVDEFSDLFKQAFEKFLRVVNELDFTPLVQALTNAFLSATWISLRSLGVAVKKGIEIITPEGGVYLDGAYLPNMAAVEAWAKNITEKNNKIQAQLDQLEVPNLSMLAKAAEMIDAENARKAQDALTQSLTASWDKLAAVATKQLERIDDSLAQIKLSKDLVLSDWTIKDVDAFAADMAYLDSQIELLGDKLMAELVKNSHYAQKLFKDYLRELPELERSALDLTDFFKIGIDETNLSETGRQLQALQEKFREAAEAGPGRMFEVLDSLREFLHDDFLSQVRDSLTALGNARIQRSSLLDKDAYLELNRAVKYINLSLGELNHQTNLINSNENLSNNEKRLRLYQKNAEQLDVLNRLLTEYRKQLAIAVRLQDEDTTIAARQSIQDTIAKMEYLRGLRDPAADVRIDRARKAYDAELSRINEQVKTIENSLVFQVQKNKHLQKLYKEQWNERAKLKLTLENEIKSIRSQGLLTERDTDLIQEYTDQIRELINEMQRLQNDMDRRTVFDGIRDGFISFRDAIGSAYDISKEITLGIGNAISTNMGNALTNVIMRTQSLSDAFAQMSLAILNSIVNMLANIVAQLVTAYAILAPLNWLSGGIIGGLLKLMSPAGLLGFAEGGRVRGGRQIVQVNEDGSEYVVSAKSPPQNDAWLEMANQGVDLNKIFAARGYVAPSSNQSRSTATARPVSQTNVTVQTHSDFWALCKQSGIVRNITREQRRMGAFA